MRNQNAKSKCNIKLQNQNVKLRYKIKMQNPKTATRWLASRQAEPACCHLVINKTNTRFCLHPWVFLGFSDFFWVFLPHARLAFSGCFRLFPTFGPKARRVGKTQKNPEKPRFFGHAGFSWVFLGFSGFFRILLGFFPHARLAFAG